MLPLPIAMFCLNIYGDPLVKPSETTKEYPPVSVRDQVVVKPKDGKCTFRWTVGRVTVVTSVNNVDVDGMLRHILDIRKLYGNGKDEDSKMEKNDTARVVEFENNGLEDEELENEEDDV